MYILNRIINYNGLKKESLLILISIIVIFLNIHLDIDDDGIWKRSCSTINPNVRKMATNFL